MTPAEIRIDEFLRAGETPRIGDVVDLHHYKYVSPHTWGEDTLAGRVRIPRGFLSDGDSGVPDLEPRAWFVHDMLYLRGCVGGQPVTRRRADWSYAWLLAKEKRIGAALLYMLGTRILAGFAWDAYRRREVLHPEHWLDRFVPHQRCWSFADRDGAPSWRTADAVWVGD